MSYLLQAALSPSPLRQVLIQRLVRKAKIGPYVERLTYEAVRRPWYGHCLYYAAELAHRLGHRSISVIEFGIAGGAGLVCLEEHIAEIERVLPITFELYGFDSGSGLPEMSDYRDLPYLWNSGDYPTNAALLEKHLRRAKLIWGDVRETVGNFYDRYSPAPLGAVMFDLDLYSSTTAAMTLLEHTPASVLPRVHCYFDDIIGWGADCFNDRTGERLAIVEFNQKHSNKYLDLAHAFRERPGRSWHQQIYICHYFEHPQYNQPLRSERQIIPLG